MQLKAEPHEGPTSLSHATVRSQLARILGSELFRRSERLSAFLRFVTAEALSGRGGVLKEQVLGSELYGKGPESDGSADPIVRVDARWYPSYLTSRRNIEVHFRSGKRTLAKPLMLSKNSPLFRREVYTPTARVMQ